MSKLFHQLTVDQFGWEAAGRDHLDTTGSELDNRLPDECTFVTSRVVPPKTITVESAPRRTALVCGRPGDVLLLSVRTYMS